jgi:hypothetical protein
MSKFPRLDDLVGFIIEREAMRRRREADEPAPWSTDEILGKYRFCNVDVQHDRVSRVIFDTITRPFVDHPGLIVGLAVCRFTNCPEVIEAVRDAIVPFDGERFVAIMADRKARRLSLERRAYMIPGGVQGEQKAISLTRDLFNLLARNLESIRPRSKDLCREVFERLRGFPYLNEGFITAQIIRDLKQVEPLRSASDWSTFVWPGPGSQRGVNRICGATTQAEIDRVRSEPEWRELFEEIVALAKPRVAEHDIDLDLQSWQNCACETDKVLRFRSGDLDGARPYTPSRKKPARRRVSKPVEVQAPAAPIEIVHALPELAAARDLNAPHVLFHDIETRSKVDLKGVGAYKYAADPSTEVLCVAYAVDDEPTQLWIPGDPVPPEWFAAAYGAFCAGNLEESFEVRMPWPPPSPKARPRTPWPP